MQSLAQFIFGIGSFVAVFFIGMVFDAAFTQADCHLAERVSEGPPLPRATEIFMKCEYLATLLLALPWFVLLGLPMAYPSLGTGYRSEDSFVLRYLAFLSLELFLVFFVILAGLMPVISFYLVMRGAESTNSDMIPSIIFILGILLILAAIIRAVVSRTK